jgi:hypothetical protein
MRMRPYIDSTRNAGLKIRRPHVVKEDEGANHPASCERKHASDLESAQVNPALGNDQFDHIVEVSD